MNKTTLFAIGIVVGAALAVGGEALFVHPASAPVAAKPGVVNAAEKISTRDKARAADLAQREAVVKAKLAELGDKAPDLNAPDEKSIISKAMNAAMKQQVDAKIAAITSRIKLTDDEDKAIRDIIGKDADYEQGMAEKMLAGQLSPDDLKKAVADRKTRQTAEDQQIQNVLTPAQYIDYQNAQNDTKKNQAQLQANAEMSQVQSSLQLTDDQKDKVFTALYSGYAAQAGVDGGKQPYDDLDIDGQFDAKKAAMQSVLTPEQFATYTKFVDSQKQMYKAILSGGAAAQ